MPLTSGTRLGAYEIVSTLGAGGIGEVYRARDTRLDRDVAIKVLPDAVMHDPDRLARFEREAKVLAALNHPLIAQVYGFEQIGDTRAIVMDWSLPLQANGKPGAAAPLLSTPTYETHGTFSPDGKLIAYMSSEQGAFDVYVRTFDGAGGRWRVSTTGGAHPTWSTNMQELMFVVDDQIMTVKYRLKGGTFDHERARAWAPVHYATAGPTRTYALHPDGKRVVVATPDTTAAATYDTVTLVFNFFDELRRLLPAAR